MNSPRSRSLDSRSGVIRRPRSRLELRIEHLVDAAAVLAHGGNGTSAPLADLYTQIFRSVWYGLIAEAVRPPGRISRCVCGAPALPDMPSLAITSPCATWRGPPTYSDKW